MVPSDFVFLLQREQYRSGMSAARFAIDILGISPAMWNLIQKGKRTPGNQTIVGAFRAFPELKDELAAALAAPNYPRTQAERKPKEAIPVG